MRPSAYKDRASILITALWIVAILTVFAVSVGKRSAISLMLTSYSTDRLRAYFIARAGILRAIEEKSLEYSLNRSVSIDALSQSWANNPELFDDYKMAGGSYTVGYEYQQLNREETEAPTLFGLMDEQSKININEAPKETIANLIALFDVEREAAEEAAAAIIDWRDEDDEATSSDEGGFYGAEDPYYKELPTSYGCKNMPFDTIYELLLVKGITKDIFESIKDHVTVYGDGKVNINTAGEIELSALFGPDFEKLAGKIMKYRKGNDEIIGTRDDRWFSIGSYVIDRAEEGLLEIKNLQDASWYANIYGIGTEEYSRIRELVAGENQQLGANSKIYRASAVGQVRDVKVRIESVYQFSGKDKAPVIRYWHQE